jgi:hypothetical protein
MRLGEQGGREWFEEMDKAFESWETRIEEVTAIDDDRVRSYTWARFKANRVERPPSSLAEP